MFGLDTAGGRAQCHSVIGANELLTTLRDRGVTNAEIGRLLDLPSSRVSEMYSGKRRLRLDEAKTLVEHYGIEEAVSPLSVPIARLLVLYGANELGVPVRPEDPRVEELARDFQAFSQFATDPRVRENEQAVQAFFQGLRLSPNRKAEPQA